ncbi:MAG: site-specific integrase [Bdellovibrionales bacterium]|nr:site-specific integrase [Bdellovibrionales bacterium]
MSVSSYEKDGKTLWKVYINIRDKVNHSVREQKLVLGFETEKAAIAEEKKLVREMAEKLIKRAALGYTWETIIDRWEMAMKNNPTIYRYEVTTIVDYVRLARRTTESWLQKPASQISIGDAREVFNRLESENKSYKSLKITKGVIQVIYKWGMEQKLIPNVHLTPVQGLVLRRTQEEKVPDILNVDEIRSLLFNAKKLEHPWYSVWAMALLTGMRNGELHALLWSDVDMDHRKITVNKSFQTRSKSVKSTKSGRWRTVPISDDLHELLLSLKSQTGTMPNVLPRHWEWDGGRQAEVLRTFCRGIGIRPVCFHALRACFATQLLAIDVAPVRIMKICGWRDLKTMQVYTRLAGVDEKGATQGLRILPDDAAATQEFANILKFKR